MVKSYQNENIIYKVRTFYMDLHGNAFQCAIRYVW